MGGKPGSESAWGSAPAPSRPPASIRHSGPGGPIPRGCWAGAVGEIGAVGIEGKSDGDRGALADDRDQSVLTVELGDKLAADRQPQAVSLDTGVLIPGQPEERLEDPIQGLSGDTGSGVGDDD